MHPKRIISSIDLISLETSKELDPYYKNGILALIEERLIKKMGYLSDFQKAVITLDHLLLNPDLIKRLSPNDTFHLTARFPEICYTLFNNQLATDLINLATDKGKITASGIHEAFSGLALQSQAQNLNFNFQISRNNGQFDTIIKTKSSNIQENPDYIVQQNGLLYYLDLYSPTYAFGLVKIDSFPLKTSKCALDVSNSLDNINSIDYPTTTNEAIKKFPQIHRETYAFNQKQNTDNTQKEKIKELISETDIFKGAKSREELTTYSLLLKARAIEYSLKHNVPEQNTLLLTAARMNRQAVTPITESLQDKKIEELKEKAQSLIENFKKENSEPVLKFVADPCSDTEVRAAAVKLIDNLIS